MKTLSMVFGLMAILSSSASALANEVSCSVEIRAGTTGRLKFSDSGAYKVSLGDAGIAVVGAQRYESAGDCKNVACFALSVGLASDEANADSFIETWKAWENSSTPGILYGKVAPYTELFAKGSLVRFDFGEIGFAPVTLTAYGARGSRSISLHCGMFEQ